MKKWSIIVASTMALLLLALNPMSAFAEGGDEAGAAPKVPPKGALAIVAPRVALIGKQVSMTVFLRADQEPFEGAGVWAVTEDQTEAFREQLSTLMKDTSIAAEAKEYETLADLHGTFIGRTGLNGKVYHTFTEAGGYLLVALTKGYFPGTTWIVARDAPRVLALEAPRRAAPGEEVVMTVRNRTTLEPVAEAGVWAVTRDRAEVLKEQMSALTQDSSVAAEEKDYEALMGLHGTLLGWTDPSGRLSHAFEEAGFYVLVAVKRGYFPGAAPISIRQTVGALAILAPQGAPAGTEVTMAVFDRLTLGPVGDARVWAITQDQVETVKEQMSALAQDSSVAAEDKDYESLVSFYGILLGVTGPDGRLSHTFEEAGFYLLVAVKKGYYPGAAPISIRDTSVPDQTAVGSGTEQGDSESQE